MEAPKEIYILTSKTPDGGLGSSYHHHPIETTKTESIKYIRADKVVDRDALMIYLNEQEKFMACGARISIRDIIDKIESL